MNRPDTTTYSRQITEDQVVTLRKILENGGWTFTSRPYTIYAASKGNTKVVVYEKGPKILVQGKGTGDFIRFVLEPQVLGEAHLGYEEVHHPDMFEPHAGVDESGKGDFFGPLVIAAAFVELESARALITSGVMDSKRITSDARLRELANIIRSTLGSAVVIVAIGPERYNELYKKFGNLNYLLAWGHAKAIELLLEKVPHCPRVVSDQFAEPRLLREALLQRGRSIQTISRTKAESDIAVAAASILARERFINWLRDAESRLGCALPKGAGPAVVETARHLVSQQGGTFLSQIAKVHFRTAHHADPELYPKPPPRHDWHVPP